MVEFAIIAIVPDLPRRRALVQFLQVLLIFKGIHALPEAIVFVCQKSLFIDEALERLAYQLLALPNVAEYFIPHCEETTVYSNICLVERLNFPNVTAFLSLYNVDICC